MTENQICFKQLQNDLPENYHFDSSGLTYKGEFLANFCPVVHGVEKRIQNDNSDMYLSIGAILATGTKVAPTKFQLTNLKRFNAQDHLDIGCYDNSSKLIVELIRYLASRHMAQDVFVADALGYIRYNDKLAYIAGDKVFGDIGIRIEAQPLGYGFHPPQNVSDKQIATYLKRILHLAPDVSPVIFTYLVLGLSRELFREAMVDVSFNLMLCGEQQTLKTTLATQLCSLYDREKKIDAHLHNLTASVARLHDALHIEKDTVVIIDDLNKDDSRAIERQQEAKLSGLIRTAANGVGRETAKDQKEVNGLPLFCCEYALTNPSTVTRLLIIWLEKGQIDRKKLLAIQSTPELLTAFANLFIPWLLNNFSSLSAYIKHAFGIFRMEQAKSNYQERLNGHIAVMKIAYSLFLNFCQEKGWEMNFSLSKFSEVMSKLVQHQINKLNLDKKEGPDIIGEFFGLYHDEKIFGSVGKGRPKDHNWKKRI